MKLLWVFVEGLVVNENVLLVFTWGLVVDENFVGICWKVQWRLCFGGFSLGGPLEMNFFVGFIWGPFEIKSCGFSLGTLFEMKFLWFFSQGPVGDEILLKFTKGPVWDEIFVDYPIVGDENFVGFHWGPHCEKNNCRFLPRTLFEMKFLLGLHQGSHLRWKFCGFWPGA
jgi:hypothetical protein